MDKTDHVTNTTFILAIRFTEAISWEGIDVTIFGITNADNSNELDKIFWMWKLSLCL